MSSKGSKTQTTKAQPWDIAVPSLNMALDTSNKMFQAGEMRVDPYQGQRVAGYSPGTKAGINMLAETANNPLTGITANALSDMITNGGNEYRDMDLIRERVSDDVKSNLANTFAGGGINSGLAGGYAYDEMAKGLAGIEYDQLNKQRNRQLAAMSMAPSIANMGREDARAMLQAGNMWDIQAQSRINAEMDHHYETENADIDALMRFSALAQGMGGLGQSGSVNSPNQSNVFSAGARGLGTYGALLGSGVGAPIAIGGGILAGLGSIL